jgi:hypothetical protein
VVPYCASVADMDAEAIKQCADGSRGDELQISSYEKIVALSYRDTRFVPVFVDDVFIAKADDNFWRKTPDQLLYGKTLLENI